LIDANTGEVIYEKNPDKPLYPASTTKVMTAILAIEKGDFDTLYITSQNAINKMGYRGSRVGLVPQEKVYLNDLLYMMMLPSGNDAANVIAENVAGSIEEFVKMMNERAKEIGAVNTTFQNPTGLDRGDGYPDHKTTARDFAQIKRYAMSLEKYRQVVGVAEYKLPITNKHKNWNKVKTTNRFYTSLSYDKNLYRVNGAKTGRTTAAANTLVVSAKNKDNIELICVVLKNYDRSQLFAEAKKLLDYGFTLIKNKEIEVTSGFYDVRFNPSKDIINSFHQQGYTGGYADNSFKPLAKASKEEFITIFLRVNHEKIYTLGEYWSQPYLDIGVKKKLIDSSWYADRTKGITRKEAIDIISKSIELDCGVEYLELMNEGILSGEYQNNDREITREEMVVLLNKYDKLKNQLIEKEAFDTSTPYAIALTTGIYLKGNSCINTLV